jgi:nitrogenase subunit NifH
VCGGGLTAVQRYANEVIITVKGEYHALLGKNLRKDDIHLSL